MTIRDWVKRSGRGLAATIALVGAVALTMPSPAQARIGTGAAVGIGRGSFALGTAVGAAARPYGYYPYGYYPPAYYAPPPAYYPAPSSCWDPYYQRYYAC